MTLQMLAIYDINVIVVLSIVETWSFLGPPIGSRFVTSITYIMWSVCSSKWVVFIKRCSQKRLYWMHMCSTLYCTYVRMYVCVSILYYHFTHVCVCVCVCVCDVCVCKHPNRHNITTSDVYMCTVCFQAMIAAFICVLIDVFDSDNVPDGCYWLTADLRPSNDACALLL